MLGFLVGEVVRGSAFAPPQYHGEWASKGHPTATIHAAGPLGPQSHRSEGGTVVMRNARTRVTLAGSLVFIVFCVVEGEGTVDISTGGDVMTPVQAHGTTVAGPNARKLLLRATVSG
jgi:hypothetical protein